MKPVYEQYTFSMSDTIIEDTAYIYKNFKVYHI
jgi:hypothetical protein